MSNNPGTEQRLPVAKIFDYVPDTFKLFGYDVPPFLQSLGVCLGERPLLARHGKRTANGRFVMPSFPLRYLDQRREFFNLMPGTMHLGDGSPFDFTFPNEEQAGGSPKQFLEFCEKVSGAINGAKEDLRPFRRVPEVRALLGKISGFDRGLVYSLKRLDEWGEADTFAVDTRRGEVVRIKEMPKRGKRIECDDLGYLFDDVRVDMKKKVVELREKGMTGFRRRVLDFVRSEFNPRNPQSVIAEYESLAIPTRLAKRHAGFLKVCANYEYDSDCEWENISETDTAPSTSPDFSDHYNIMSLYPPSLMNSRYAKDHVPIDFKTEKGEKKFLVVGLHSGGKSFFLDNLVALSIAGQVPLMFPSDELTIPKYRRIFYHKGTGRTRRGLGKCETEVVELREIFEQSRRGDAVFVDEMLDSAEPNVGDYLVPELLKRANKSDATVFVSTHRVLDYRKYQRQGWTILTPDYKIEKELVVPTRTISRGIPDSKINLRYIQQRYDPRLRAGRVSD